MAKPKKPTFEKVAVRMTRDGKSYGCSLGKDEKGYFVYTHRARSKSYADRKSIPMKDIKFIDSTC